MKSINDENYFFVDIQIKSAKKILTEVFNQLSNENLTSGVIKVDVEGYEPVVLRAIAQSLPPNFKAMIVFESWDEDFKIQEILDCFKVGATAYKLTAKNPWNSRFKRISQLFSLLFNRNVITTLVEVGQNDNKLNGDLVIKVN